MQFIDEVEIKNKTILLRVDFNVSLNANLTIADDLRIRQSIPTIEHLLKHGNKLILISHFRKPEERNVTDSLLRIKHRLSEYLPKHKVWFVVDFLKNPDTVTQNDARVVLLENIRFYPGEMANDPKLAKQLASLGDVYVNDAFSESHRKATSIVGLPKLLPSYGGLLLKKEITMIGKLMKKPKKPFVALIGGKKITTKIKFIDKLASMADFLLLGGGLANTFVAAEGHGLGNTHMDEKEVEMAKHILSLARKEHTRFVLPKDAVVGDELDSKTSEVKKINAIDKNDHILDIGPETQAEFSKILSEAATIVWNGPVGYIENPVFKRGTDFLYYAITENETAVSIIGGGDTLAAISKKEYLDKITHISTGGGAMLEFIENGTLPGIEALKNR